MKMFFKIVGGLFGLLVLVAVILVAFVMITMRPNLPDSEFVLRTPAQVVQQSVLVVGATGKLGTEIVKDLTAQGDKVTAFVRSTSNRAPLEPLGAAFAVGDVLEPESLDAAFAAGEFDAVIVAIAGSSDANLDRDGNINVADAAVAAGVDRLIMISTVGAGDSYDAAPLVSRFVLSKVLPQKTAAEEHIRRSVLDYTILRPGGLPPGIIPTGEGLLSEDVSTMGYIKRPDLARLTVGVLRDDRTIGKTFAVVDPSLESFWSGGDDDDE